MLPFQQFSVRRNELEGFVEFTINFNTYVETFESSFVLTNHYLWMTVYDSREFREGHENQIDSFRTFSTG